MRSRASNANASSSRRRFCRATQGTPERSLAAERSLQRLRFDYLDLYLLHWPGSHPLEETMRALRALVEQGKTRFVGVSNFEAGRDARSGRRIWATFRWLATRCSIISTNAASNTRSFPRRARAGIAVVAYTPFGRGSFLRGRGRRREALDAVAAKHRATPRQVVLAFLTAEPELFAIPKAARLEHVEENAAAGALELDAGDLAAIDAVFPRGRLATAGHVMNQTTLAPKKSRHSRYVPPFRTAREQCA